MFLLLEKNVPEAAAWKILRACIISVANSWKLYTKVQKVQNPMRWWVRSRLSGNSTGRDSQISGFYALKSWNMANFEINHLDEKANKVEIKTIPNPVSSVLVNNGKISKPEKNITRMVRQDLGTERSPFRWSEHVPRVTFPELKNALRCLKTGMAPDPEKSHNEFFLHLDLEAQSWLYRLFWWLFASGCIPNAWFLARIVCKTFHWLSRSLHATLIIKGSCCQP